MEDHSLALEYITMHVFCPLRLPGADDHTHAGDQALIGAVVDAANAYSHVADAGQSKWPHIQKMLESLAVTVPFPRLNKNRVVSQLRGMQCGGMHLIPLRVLWQVTREITRRRPRVLHPGSKRGCLV